MFMCVICCEVGCVMVFIGCCCCKVVGGILGEVVLELLGYC